MIRPAANSVSRSCSLSSAMALADQVRLASPALSARRRPWRSARYSPGGLGRMRLTLDQAFPRAPRWWSASTAVSCLPVREIGGRRQPVLGEAPQDAGLGPGKLMRGGGRGARGVPIARWPGGWKSITAVSRFFRCIAIPGYAKQVNLQDQLASFPVYFYCPRPDRPCFAPRSQALLGNACRGAPLRVPFGGRAGKRSFADVRSQAELGNEGSGDAYVGRHTLFTSTVPGPIGRAASSLFPHSPASLCSFSV